VGLDTVDLNAATLRGIPVIYTPFANANAVAEHAVHLMFGLARQTLAGDEAVRGSRFDIRDSLIGFELRHTTLGIVGLGAVGMRVAEVCHKGLDMRLWLLIRSHSCQPSILSHELILCVSCYKNPISSRCIPAHL